MGKIRRKLKCFTAMLLALMMFITSVPLPAHAAEAEPKNEERLNPTGVNFSIGWKNYDGSDLRWDETEDVSHAVSMLVSYSCKKVREEGYKPGDLIITLNGIGSSNRGGAVEALVGADKAGSTVKNRDWTYTYNRSNDTYTLVNNKAIEGGSVFTGYFELIWSLNARSTIHEYNQDVNATMYLPYGDGTATINSNTLNFATTMEKDTCSIAAQAVKIASAEGLEGKLPEGTTKDDYYFVKYYITGQKNMHARGLKSGEYIDITFDDNMVLLGSNRSYSETGTENKYRFNASYGSIGISTSYNPFYIYAAYKKSDYSTVTNATIDVDVRGTFHEETDESSLAQTTLTINVADFNFTDVPGDIYDIYKSGSSHYQGKMNDGCYYDGFLNGGIMGNGETASFTLHTTIRNPENKLGYTGASWKLEYVDDWMYIMRNDGTYRKLENDEYEFTSVTLPSVTSLDNWNGYPLMPGVCGYIVYASVNAGYNDRKEVARGYLDGSSHTIKLPAGTNLYSVVLNNLKEGAPSLPINCSVKYHIKEKETVEERKDNLENGTITNTFFMKLFDDKGRQINDNFTADNYTDKDMAAEDMRTYGDYLDREKKSLHIHQRYSDFNNSVYLSSFADHKRGFTATANNSTSFDYLEDDTLSKVSSYILFPEGLTLMPDVTFPEAIWDYVSISGMGKDAEYLADHCTIEFTDDYKGSGRTYVAFHFDFSDSPFKPSASLSTSVKAFLSQDNYKEYGNSYNIYGVSIIDETTAAINPVFHRPDNGSWCYPTTLGKDIDNDSDLDELISVKNDSSTIIHAASSQLALNKWVQTSYTNRLFVQDVDMDEDGEPTGDSAPFEELSGTYQYKLKLSNGNNISTGIVVTDILETGPNMQWQGTLVSVDTSYAENLGFKPEVTYAKTSSPAAGSWTDDPTGAKAVRIDFGDGILAEGQELYILINMKAPAGLENVGKLTENGYSASFTMIDSASGEETKWDELTSNYVQVKLSKPRYNVILDKKDEISDAVLSGAVFELIDSKGTVVAQGETNAKGRLIFRDIEESLYTLHEAVAPMGYEPIKDVQLNITGDGDHRTLYYSVKDPRKKGTVILTKHNDLDHSITVPGATYTLYNAADGSIVKDDIITDTNGQLTVNGLEWGSYYFQEKESPEGYLISDAKIPFTVSRENVLAEIKVSAIDPQIPASVTLLKYEKLEDGTVTENPLQGAFFVLYKDLGENGLEELGVYGTGADGSLMVDGLAYGDYIFKELKAPNGYAFVEDIPFTLDVVHRELVVTAHDERITGKLLVIKSDTEGHALNGVSFELQNADGTVFAEDVTDINGTISFENIPWGDYKLVEKETLPGYIIDTEPKNITIGPDSLTIRVKVVNERETGSVKLVKVDEEGKKLPDAEYALYKNDGSLVKGGLVTDVNGEIIVTGLDWGTYYFKETKAPAGYGLSGELIRFSINGANAGETLEVEAVDKIETKQVTVTKKILYDDIYFDHGIPTFIFTLRGVDAGGVNRAWNKIVSFTPENIAGATAGEYVSQSVTFTDIPAGTYTAFESTVSRYDFNRIEDISANGQIIHETVEFDLMNYDDGHATFVNDKKEWQDYSDASSITNMVKASRKLVGLKVVYDGPAVLDAGTELTQYLTVAALYDDGNATVLTTDNYTISTPVAPYQSGDYTVTVGYTEGGVTKKGTFTFSIHYNDSMHPEVVSMTLESKSGTRPDYDPGGAITQDEYICKVKYNTGDIKILTRDEYSLNYTIAPSELGLYNLQASYTEYGTVYKSNTVEFKVKQLHLNDYSWEQIQQIVASGKGEEVFAECYENGCCKVIHLSAATTESDYDADTSGVQNAIAEQDIAVNILEFNHDTPTDGGTEPNATFGMAVAKKVTVNGDTNYVANQTTSINGGVGNNPGIMNELVSMENKWSNYSGATVMHMFLDTVYAQCLPEDLRNIIVPVDKKSSAGKESSTINIRSEKLFLFTEVELFGHYCLESDGTKTEQGNNWGTGSTSYGYLNSFAGEGYQYGYYSDVNDPANTTLLKNRLRRKWNWWEASPNSCNSDFFCFVSGRGYACYYINGGFRSSYVSFGFTIR